MSAETEGPTHTKVYTTPEGCTVIEQSQGSIVLSAEQILTVIRELHVCYDYCAAWKDTTRREAETSLGTGDLLS